MQKSSFLVRRYTKKKAPNSAGITTTALASKERSATVNRDRKIGNAMFCRNQGSLSKNLLNPAFILLSKILNIIKT